MSDYLKSHPNVKSISDADLVKVGNGQYVVKKDLQPHTTTLPSQKKVYVTKYGVYDAKTGKLISKPKNGYQYDINSFKQKYGGQVKGNYSVGNTMIADKGVLATIPSKETYYVEPTNVTVYTSNGKEKLNPITGIVTKQTTQKPASKKTNPTSVFSSNPYVAAAKKNPLSVKETSYGVVYTSATDPYRSITIKAPSETEIKQSYNQYVKKAKSIESSNKNVIVPIESYSQYKKEYLSAWKASAESAETQAKVKQQFVEMNTPHKNQSSIYASDKEVAQQRMAAAKQAELEKAAEKIYNKNAFVRTVESNPFTAPSGVWGGVLVDEYNRQKKLSMKQRAASSAKTATLSLAPPVAAAYAIKQFTKSAQRGTARKEAVGDIYKIANGESGLKRTLNTPYVVAGSSYVGGVAGGAAMTGVAELAPPTVAEAANTVGMAMAAKGVYDIYGQYKRIGNSNLNPAEKVGAKVELLSAAAAGAIGFKAGSTAMKSYLNEVVTPAKTVVEKEPTKIKVTGGRVAVRPETKYKLPTEKGSSEFTGYTREKGVASMKSSLNAEVSGGYKVVQYPAITRKEAIQASMWKNIYTKKIPGELAHENKLFGALFPQENPLPKPEVVKTFHIENAPAKINTAANVKVLEENPKVGTRYKVDIVKQDTRLLSSEGNTLKSLKSNPTTKEILTKKQVEVQMPTPPAANGQEPPKVYHGVSTHLESNVPPSEVGGQVEEYKTAVFSKPQEMYNKAGVLKGKVSAYKASRMAGGSFGMNGESTVSLSKGVRVFQYEIPEDADMFKIDVSGLKDLAGKGIAFAETFNDKVNTVSAPAPRSLPKIKIIDKSKAPLAEYMPAEKAEPSGRALELVTKFKESVEVPKVSKPMNIPHFSVIKNVESGMTRALVEVPAKVETPTLPAPKSSPSYAIPMSLPKKSLPKPKPPANPKEAFSQKPQTPKVAVAKPTAELQQIQQNRVNEIKSKQNSFKKSLKQVSQAELKKKEKERIAQYSTAVNVLRKARIKQAPKPKEIKKPIERLMPFPAGTGKNAQMSKVFAMPKTFVKGKPNNLVKLRPHQVEHTNTMSIQKALQVLGIKTKQLQLQKPEQALIQQQKIQTIQANVNNVVRVHEHPSKPSFAKLFKFGGGSGFKLLGGNNKKGKVVRAKAKHGEGIYPDEYSILKSRLLFGKATPPSKKELKKALKIAKTTGYNFIPTQEMLNRHRGVFK